MIFLVLTYLCPIVILIGSSPALAPSVPTTYFNVNNAAPSTLGLASILGLTAVIPVGFAAGPRYVPKWKKQACEIPAAQHPNSHYVCDEAGEVKCIPGWTGDLCDVPLCRKGCDPLQGYCRRPGECRCKLGFYGELCDKCVPLPGCQHGGCNVSFECACDPGWKGLFCSEPICDSECHPNQGYCEKPGECRCRIGWQGPKCKQCSVLPGCSHGTCQGPLECRCDPGWTGFLCQTRCAHGTCQGPPETRCDPGWTGSLCQTPICSQGCSREHGSCNRPGTCRCRVGWTGPNCTECVPYPGCGHGSCRRPWECRCEPGWAGDLCEEKLTYCDHHSDLCKNNGTCVSMPKEDGDYRCICPLGYIGRQCQIQTTVPATDLTPPLQETPIFIITPEAATTTTERSVTSEETIENSNEPKPITFVNSHQGHEVHSTTEKMEIPETTSVEPLETIFVTDPSTIDPSATAGKWPTEPPTEIPATDNDADNEA